MLKIESDTWRLWSEPDVGVQWMAGEVWHRNQWLALMPDCRQPAQDSSTIGVSLAGQSPDAPLAAANFHMLPYSNRIRDGRFSFQGQTYQLDAEQRHAIHGAVRKLPWKLVSHSEQLLVCELQSSDHRDVNWPWPFQARIELWVDGAALSSTLTLTNLGDTAMPAGGGWHPYFVRSVLGSEANLTLPLSGVFPDSNGDCLPDGAAVPVPAELDFTASRLLDPDQRIDNCFAGLDGACEIDWQGAGVRLSMQASALCRYLVLYNPDMPHFAVEPVSNANDAFNLASRDIKSGMQVLAPQESLTITMALTAHLT